MKRLLLTASLTSLLIPGNAIAQEDCGNSYMVLPNSNCVNMSYLTVLGQSRNNLAVANEMYQQEFDANLALELNPYYIETERQRNDRYRSLAETSIMRDQVSTMAEDVEGMLFPIHTEAMYRIRNAYQ